VPEEEDQVRREDASMLTLHQLQDRVHLYTGREEASAAQRVRVCEARVGSLSSTNTRRRAKYIEGLENRLGRMESLLKQSGLVNEEDWGRTDLGTIEKRLAEQNRRRSSPGTPSKSPTDSTSTNTIPRPSSESQRTTPQVRQSATPNSSAPSPNPVKDKEQDKEDAKKKEKAREEEVEALSDMMCSLVTNNCGETRYIGGLGWDKRRINANMLV